MNSMFCSCQSLSSLPDISKWNTQKVTNIDSIFSGCSSLTSLPNISNWNIQNINSLKEILKDNTSFSKFARNF